MNPFNMIINYLIADSRAKHYNVVDKNKVQNTALLMGMFSQNPVVDYIVIDNQAKNLPKIDTKTVISQETAASNQQNSNSDTKDLISNNSNQGSESITLKQIKEQVTEVITERLSGHFLNSENSETNKVLKDFKKQTSKLRVISDKKDFAKSKVTIEELLKNKNLDSLDESDKETIGVLKNLIKKGGSFNKIETILDTNEEVSTADLLMSGMIISNIIRDIQSKLDEIEKDKVASLDNKK